MLHNIKDAIEYIGPLLYSYPWKIIAFDIICKAKFYRVIAYKVTILYHIFYMLTTSIFTFVASN